MFILLLSIVCLIYQKVRTNKKLQKFTLQQRSSKFYFYIRIKDIKELLLNLLNQNMGLLLHKIKNLLKLMDLLEKLLVGII
jgi:hypothetical protein